VNLNRLRDISRRKPFGRRRANDNGARPIDRGETTDEAAIEWPLHD
jgi:hypothetical protein